MRLRILLFVNFALLAYAIYVRLQDSTTSVHTNELANSIANGDSNSIDQPLATGELSDDVTELIHKVADFYRRTEAFQVDCENQTDFTLDRDSEPIKLHFPSTIAVARPNKIAIRYRKNMNMESTAVSDGKVLSLYNRISDDGKFSQDPAPDSLDDLVEHDVIAADLGGPGPLLDLFSSDPYSKLCERVKPGAVVGHEKLDQIDTDFLKYQADHGEWQIWFAAGSEPHLVQVRKYVSGPAGSDNQKLRPPANGGLQTTQRYTNWRFASPASEEFAFDPPENARKVGDVRDTLESDD